MTLGGVGLYQKQIANTEEKAHFKSRENGEGGTSRGSWHEDPVLLKSRQQDRGFREEVS